MYTKITWEELDKAVKDMQAAFEAHAESERKTDEKTSKAH